MKKKKVIVSIGVVVVIGALCGTGYHYRSELMSVIPVYQTANSGDKVYVEKLSKVIGNYTGTSNRYNGVVESQDTYDVSVDSSRTIKEILVEVGDTVEEGQTLVTYDTSDIEMQIKQANLELESIHNEIDNYNREIENLNVRLSVAEDDEERFSYTTEIQSTQNSIEQSNFDLESKELEISKYKKQLEESTVVSKQAGVVREINEEGVDSSGNSASFMKIMQTGEYRVKGTIDEQNVWTITDGAGVVIRSRVDDTKTWNGTISKVDTENTQQGNNNDAYSSSDSPVSATKYPFYIELESADGLLLGQHVYIEMDEGQEEEKEGIWLFSNYVVQDDTGVYVWTANDKNRLEKRYVELGEVDEETSEYQILSGLTEEDYITWPMAGLYEGVTTVTNVDEVDYNSPLYNQESSEMPEEGMDMNSYGTDEMPPIPEGAEPIYDLEDTEGMDETFSVDEIYDTEVEE